MARCVCSRDPPYIIASIAKPSAPGALPFFCTLQHQLISRTLITYLSLPLFDCNKCCIISVWCVSYNVHHSAYRCLFKVSEYVTPTSIARSVVFLAIYRTSFFVQDLCFRFRRTRGCSAARLFDCFDVRRQRCGLDAGNRRRRNRRRQQRKVQTFPRERHQRHPRKRRQNANQHHRL